MELKDRISLLQAIDSESFPTGSKAYGLSTWCDEDRVCTRDSFDSIMRHVEPHWVELSSVEEMGEYPETRAVRFELCGCKFHVFHVPDEELASWKICTEIMKSIQHALPGSLDDKTVRVSAFRRIRETIRDTEKFSAQLRSKTIAPGSFDVDISESQNDEALDTR